MRSFALPTLAALAALVCSTTASPVNLAARALPGVVTDVQIHSSCNSTQRRQLTKALSDMVEFATVARDYTAGKGPQDPLFLKYFGNGDWVTVLGAFDALLYSNKQGVILRCDDPDDNCRQAGWAGHWRGSNATSETVICDLSYTTRLYLEQFCTRGYTVAGSNPSLIFANDLVHRMFHIPGISDSEIAHVDGGDSYSDCLNLAKTNATWAPLNTHSLQFFAAEVYANEVAAPGSGCLGTPSADSGHAAPAAAVSASASHDHDHDDHSHAPTSAGPTATGASARAAPSPTESVGCVPHDDHWQCVLPTLVRPLMVHSCEAARPTA